MFIRIFANTTIEDDAKSIYEKVKDSIELNIKSEEIIKLEPYWKMDGVYVIEAELDFIESLGEVQLEQFLNSIAENWQFFGSPVDEALASEIESKEGSIMQGVRMINIFY